MEAQVLAAKTRTDTGKGAARELRRQGNIPAVFYGPKQEALSLAVSPKELSHALGTDYGRNQVITLDLDGSKRLAVIQELQVHPVTRQPLHVDFLAIEADSVVERKVLFTTSGRARGVLAGGELTKLFRHLPVRATADKVPSVINVDVTDMDLGDTVQVKDISLEDGAVINMAADRNVITLQTARRRVEKKGAEEEEEVAAS